MHCMPWRPMRLRGVPVLARCNERGEPLRAGDGRVEIRYRPRSRKAYFARPENLEPIEGASVLPETHCLPDDQVTRAERKASRGKERRQVTPGPSRVPGRDATPPPENALVAYTDGACSGNPGPAGLGAVLLDGEQRWERSEYLGPATNNVAELTAILRAAEWALERGGNARPVRIHTDSTYAIGVLQRGWRAKANQDLVRRVQSTLRRLPDVALHYVKGHAGHPLNERADQLARQAIERRGDTGWRLAPAPTASGR